MTHTAIDPNDPNSALPLSQEALEFGFSTFHPPQQRWFLRMLAEEVRLVDALLAGRDVAAVSGFSGEEADDFRSLRETVLGFAGKETLPKLSDYDEETAKMLRADVSVGMHGKTDSWAIFRLLVFCDRLTVALADLQRTDAVTRGDARRLAEALRSLGLDDETSAPMLAARRFHLEILEELTCLHGFDAESRAVTVSVLPTKPVMVRDLNAAMRKFSHRTVAQVSWLHNQLLAVLVDLADGRKELVPALREAFKGYKSPIAGFWEEQLRQCFIAKDVFARDAGDFDAADALRQWPEEYFEPMADQLSTKLAARPLIQAIAALYEMVAVITDSDVDYAGELAASECRTDEGEFASKAARTVVLAARRASSIKLTVGDAASLAQAQTVFDAPALAAHLLEGTFFVDRHTYPLLIAEGFYFADRFLREDAFAELREQFLDADPGLVDDLREAIAYGCAFLDAVKPDLLFYPYGLCASISQDYSGFPGSMRSTMTLAAEFVGGRLTDDSAEGIKGIEHFRKALLAVSRLQSLAADTLRNPEDGIIRRELRNNDILAAAMPFFENLRSWELLPPPKADEHGQFLLFTAV